MGLSAKADKEWKTDLYFLYDKQFFISCITNEKGSQVIHLGVNKVKNEPDSLKKLYTKPSETYF